MMTKKEKKQFELELSSARWQGIREGTDDTEKRLALDWRDIALLDDIMKDLKRQGKGKHIIYRDFCENVLYYFNKERREK